MKGKRSLKTETHQEQTLLQAIFNKESLGKNLKNILTVQSNTIINNEKQYKKYVHL